MSRVLALVLVAMVVLALAVPTLIPTSLAAPTSPLNTQTSDEVSINWEVSIIDMPRGKGHVYGTCIFGDYLVVVGEPRFILFLDKDSGRIVKKYVDENWRPLINCISIDNRLYVVGFNVIIVFNENLDKIEEIARPDVRYVSIDFDGKYIYLGGIAFEDVNNDGEKETVWLVEKRTIDLDLVTSRKIYPYKWIESALLDLGVSNTSNRVWVVGYSVPSGSTEYHSLAIVLDSNNLEVLKIIDYPASTSHYLHWLKGVCFDKYGYAYIVGDAGFAKFDPSGNPVVIYGNRFSFTVDKIKCIGDKVYVFRYAGEGKSGLRILNIDLDILKEYILFNYSDPAMLPLMKGYIKFNIGKPAFDGRKLYVAGEYSSRVGYAEKILVYSITIPQTSPLLTPKKGSIGIRVHNIRGMKLPEGGGTISVKIFYNSSGEWHYANADWLSYKESQDYVELVLTGLELNRFYYFMVYHEPSYGLKLGKYKLKEYWGGMGFVLKSVDECSISITLYVYDPTTDEWIPVESYKSESLFVPVEFYRSRPYIASVTYNIMHNNRIEFNITVKNADIVPRSFYITVILDRDLKLPFDIMYNTTTYKILPNDTISIPVTLKIPNQTTYIPYIILYSHDGETIYDQWDGSGRPIEIAEGRAPPATTSTTTTTAALPTTITTTTTPPTSVDSSVTETATTTFAATATTKSMTPVSTTTTTPSGEATSLPLVLIVVPIIILVVIAVILLLRRR